MQTYFFFLISKFIIIFGKIYKMKYHKICVTIGAIVTFQTSDAQVYLSPSVEIGKGYSVSNSNNMSNLNTASYQNVSLNVGYMYLQKIALFTGIGMGTYAHDYINYDNNALLTVVEQNRLEIPLFFHFQTSKKQKVNFTGNLGLKMGILTKLTAYNYDGNEMSNAGIDAHKTNFQQTTSLGVSFRIKDRNFLDVYVFHNLQLTEAYSKGNLPFQINNFGLRTSFSWCKK